jgi:hypothetical protein
MGKDKMSDARDMACFWYTAAAYEKLRDLSCEQLQEVSECCSKYSLAAPLGDIREKKYSLPHVGEGLSGLAIVAYFTVATDMISGYQISDHDMSGFKWLKEARTLARSS